MSPFTKSCDIESAMEKVAFSKVIFLRRVQFTVQPLSTRIYYNFIHEYLVRAKKELSPV